MRVLVTGASSYTGMCVARQFARRGDVTMGLLTRSRGAYRGRQKKRLELLNAEGVQLFEEVRAEDGSMAAWATRQRIDLWVHHHHPMEKFRSPEYDLREATRVALDPLAELARAWRQAGVGAVVFSGTYFEPGEGGQGSAEGGTPYARFKKEVSDRVEQAAEQHGVRFAKVVIPSPTGALENEDRLTPQLLLAAAENREFVVRSPNSVFDHIPGDELGRAYVDLGHEVLAGSSGSGPRIRRPSGWTVSAADWVSWSERAIVRRMGLELRLRVVPVEEQLPPTVFKNPLVEKVPADWDDFAERYVEEWKQYYPFF